jgi:hypothetical protein
MPMTEGDRAKLQGMMSAKSSEERDNPGFTERMLSTIYDIAVEHAELHIDLFADAEKPQHPNCLGSVWTKAIKLGWIEPTGEWRKSTVDSIKHARKYPIYRSNVFRAA